MDETPREPVMVWPLLRRNFVRIVIGCVLAVAVYGLLIVWMPYQRERRIAREIESHGGVVKFAYFGPGWIRRFVKGRLPYFDRIRDVYFTDQVVSANLLSELRSLSSLEQIHLVNTQFTDAGLEQLKGLTSLRILYLDNTQVTDAGLENLKGLTRLEWLSLNSTQVADAGLEHLKGLSNLNSLVLVNAQVTDAGLEPLKGLTRLTNLFLSSTQVTDTGLEHLKELTSLKNLYVEDTKVTAEGRVMLRKALPNCRIHR